LGDVSVIDEITIVWFVLVYPRDQSRLDSRKDQIYRITVVHKDSDDKVKVFFVERWMGKHHHLINQANDSAFLVRERVL